MVFYPESCSSFWTLSLVDQTTATEYTVVEINSTLVGILFNCNEKYSRR